MGAFKSAVITNKGQALITKSVLGTAKLEFTKIAVSENTLTGDLASKTGIGTIKQSVKVASVSRTSNASVKVSASISNESLTSGYYIRNIGLYVMDPDEGEILYSISVADESNATADWMPPFNGVGVSSLMIDLITVVSNADNVTVEVDPTASATVAQINDLQSQINSNYEELTPSKIVTGTVIGVNDSAGLPLIGLKLFGKTDQIGSTGSEATPSPKNIQELVSAGEDGSIVIDLIGKNLVFANCHSYNADYATLVETTDLRGVRKGKTYTASVTLTSTADTTVYFNSLSKLYNNRSIAVTAGTARYTFTFESLNDGNKASTTIILLTKSATGDGVSVTASDFQIEEGSVATEYTAYAKQTLTAQTPNGVPAIPVTDASLATYTDESGKMWCTDEIDFERGLYIKRVHTHTIQATDITKVDNANTQVAGTIADITLPQPYFTIVSPKNACVMCDRAVGIPYSSRGNNPEIYRIYSSDINGDYVTFRYPKSVGNITLDTAKEDLTGATIQYILAEPVEIPLTGAEIKAYTDLKTNYPSTTVLSNTNAFISMEYVKKAYSRALGNLINRFAETVDISSDFVSSTCEILIEKIVVKKQGNIISGYIQMRIDHALPDDREMNITINDKYTASHRVYCPLYESTLDMNHVTISGNIIDYGITNGVVGSAQFSFWYICEA